MRNIELIPVKSLKGLDPKEFCVNPSCWSYDMEYSYNAKDAMEEATRKAADMKEICIAVVHDELGTYVLGESCAKGMQSKFILFNAVKCNRADAEMRAITFNTGRGATTKYWVDMWIAYHPGSMA